jgi:hypothetical protein
MEPVAEGDNDTTMATLKAEYEKAKVQRDWYDRVALMIMKHTIGPTI